MMRARRGTWTKLGEMVMLAVTFTAIAAVFIGLLWLIAPLVGATAHDLWAITFGWALGALACYILSVF